MKAAVLKDDLHQKIEHADFSQLKEIYGLMMNYFNSNESDEEWELLSESQRTLIDKSIEQADAGLGTSLKVINERLRKKHGLND